MTDLWGEIPEDFAPGISAAEKEQITKPRPIEVEGPSLHQPSSTHHPPTTEPHPAELFSIDSLTLHTIRLVQYARKIRSMMHSVQQQVEAARTEEKELPQFNPAPPIPEYEGPEPKHKLQKPIPFMSKDVDNDFVRGIGTAPPEIDSKSCRKLLRRSVAALCAHAGFDTCPESMLETLTDITHEYMLQFTKLMRSARDSEALHGSAGFPDIMEQVFHEIGHGSMLNLHDYYQNRVVRYHAHMLHTCELLRNDYDKLRNPDIKSLDDLKPLLNVKQEPMSDIQFPAMEDNDDTTDEQPLALEGLQGLEMSMGQESMQSLNNEDESSSRWGQHKGADQPQYETRVSSLEVYEQEDSQGGGADGGHPHTPALGSEGGESIQDPGSVPVSDIMSPQSIGMRVPSKPPPNKKRKA